MQNEANAPRDEAPDFVVLRTRGEPWLLALSNRLAAVYTRRRRCLKACWSNPVITGSVMLSVAATHLAALWSRPDPSLSTARD